MIFNANYVKRRRYNVLLMSHAVNVKDESAKIQTDLLSFNVSPVDECYVKAHRVKPVSWFMKLLVCNCAVTQTKFLNYSS